MYKGNHGVRREIYNEEIEAQSYTLDGAKAKF